MDTGDTSILRRKLAVDPGQPAPDAATTPERVLRLALEKAVDRAIGLAVSVTDVAVSIVGLDDLIAVLDPADLLVAVNGRAGPAGLIGADTQTVIALVERQTMGRLAAAFPAARGLTGTDMALSLPVLAAVLRGLPGAAIDSDLAGWADGYGVGPRISGPRAASMVLDEGAFRLVRLTLDFGIAARVGALTLALPVVRGVPAAVVNDLGAGKWARQLQNSVMAAPAELVAVLHRLRLPLRAVEGFVVGQVIPLDGTTVGSVQLETPDGAVMAQARLGQAAGLRAVRIQGAAALQMRDGGLGMPRGAAVADRVTAADPARVLID